MIPHRTLRCCTSVVIVRPICGGGRIYDTRNRPLRAESYAERLNRQPPRKIMPKAQIQAKDATDEPRTSRPVGVRLLHTVNAYLRKEQRGKGELS